MIEVLKILGKILIGIVFLGFIIILSPVIFAGFLGFFTYIAIFGDGDI